MIPAAVPVGARVGDCERSGEEPAAASASKAFARPKSSTFTLPSGVSLTFAGLRSRWTMPLSWAASRASAIWLAIPRASSTGTLPRFSRRARSSPRTSSIARNCTDEPPPSAALSNP